MLYRLWIVILFPDPGDKVTCQNVCASEVKFCKFIPLTAPLCYCFKKLKLLTNFWTSYRSLTGFDCVYLERQQCLVDRQTIVGHTLVLFPWKGTSPSKLEWHSSCQWDGVALIVSVMSFTAWNSCTPTTWKKLLGHILKWGTVLIKKGFMILRIDLRKQSAHKMPNKSVTTYWRLQRQSSSMTQRPSSWISMLLAH